ncbi:MAG: guanylate kinase [Calditrichaceae bacterium]|nr:guanylate kinase [Calditrichaceae bacterium]HES59254.1 guanylate kinase [Caldithrix sp.]
MKFNSSYYVFSAPSGGGKTTIVNKLAEKYSDLTISVSATTRKRRNYEVDGREYIFLSVEAFNQAIADGKFLEFEQVHGDYYGTLKETVEGLVQSGKTVLFDIDVNGAFSVKRNYPQAVLFFIKPPNQKELVKRLKGRNSETEISIQRRLNRLDYEYAQADKFDHIIINDNLEHAIEQIEDIILV